MKLLGFKYILIILTCFYGHIAQAQKSYEERMEHYQAFWNSLIPRYGKIQFAGGMGIVSIGPGWDYGHKKQWETDLLFGYLHRFGSDEGYGTMTIKQNYIPWRKKFSSWNIEPFTASLYFNKIFGENFWTREPDKYPNNYYGVATNLRINIAFGQRLNLQLSKKKYADKLCLYYEVCSNDLYIISWATNKYLKLSDIFSLSLGIKFQFL